MFHTRAVQQAAVVAIVSVENSSCSAEDKKSVEKSNPPLVVGPCHVIEILLSDGLS